MKKGKLILSFLIAQIMVFAFMGGAMVALGKEQERAHERSKCHPAQQRCSRIYQNLLHHCCPEEKKRGFHGHLPQHEHGWFDKHCRR